MQVQARQTGYDSANSLDIVDRRSLTPTAQLFPRRNLTLCNAYASKIKSYCDAGDTYCSAGNNTAVHGSYFANYTTEAVSWIVSKYTESKASGAGNSTGGNNGTDTTPTPSPTPTPSNTVPKGQGMSLSPSLGLFAMAAVAAMSLNFGLA